MDVKSRVSFEIDALEREEDGWRRTATLRT